jgi:hypothetical protein
MAWRITQDKKQMKEILTALNTIADVLYNIVSQLIKMIAPMIYKKIRPYLLLTVKWGLKRGYITLARPTGFIPFIG